MCPGDIVYGHGNTNEGYPKGGHPIVFLRENNEYTFVGVMLSSKNYKGKYVKMDEFHIKINNERGDAFEFQYSNTHLVPLELLKRSEWEPFTKVGELSTEGLMFVQNAVEDSEPIFWEEALERDKNTI